jgi:hypothetical protein
MGATPRVKWSLLITRQNPSLLNPHLIPRVPTREASAHSSLVFTAVKLFLPTPLARPDAIDDLPHRLSVRRTTTRQRQGLVKEII